MQHQTQYYRTVPVSEKPKKFGDYFVNLKNRNTDGPLIRGTVEFFTDSRGSFWQVDARQWEIIEWLEPIAIPDAETLREALEKVKQNLSGWEDTDTMMGIAINHINNALSAVGDGWVRVEDGCEMPGWGESVLVIIPKHGDEYFNPFTAKYQGDGFYVKKRRVDDKYFAGEPSHWRPLPPQPNK